MQIQFESLKVWQLAMRFVTEVYQMTQKFPKDEQYGLTGQLRRASISIPSNIAEGKGRTSKKEYSQFLSISKGSLYECITLIQVSENLTYLSKDQAKRLLDHSNELSAMLTGLIRSVE